MVADLSGGPEAARHTEVLRGPRRNYDLLDGDGNELVLVERLDSRTTTTELRVIAKWVASVGR